VGNLANLELLSLYNNTLTGTLPQTMGNMSSLKWVGLWSNNFTGSIPYTFQNLTNLETLYLDRNQFNSIENATFSTTNLIKIVLSNNNITGDISDSMCEMAKNKTLKCDFSGNNFTCPFRCEEFKRVCKAKCVKLDEGPKERKKKKKPDPNEDLRLMPQIQRVAEVEGCLNQSRFSELMLYYVNQNLDEKALESLFKAFDFDKGGNITADELEGF
jgi:Leucine-rich repeat (LRR) protein